MIPNKRFLPIYRLIKLNYKDLKRKTLFTSDLEVIPKTVIYIYFIQWQFMQMYVKVTCVH